MAVAYNPKIVTDGLALCLDASNPKSYPGTGNTWFDLSGNNNHCVWDSLPTYNATHFTFNGTSNFGTITNNFSLNFANEQTLIIIMRHSHTDLRRNPWDQAYGGYGTWTHEYGVNINQYFGDAGTNATPYVGLTSPTTERNVWNVMCSTRNTVEQKWYKNGSLASTTAHSYGTLTTTTANIRIGRGYAGYWTGDMAIVLAYTRALTAIEVNQNFNATRGRFGI